MIYHIALSLLFFAALALFRPERDLARGLASTSPRPQYHVFRASDERRVFESLGEGEKINASEYGVETPNPFGDAELEAASAYVIDLTTGEVMYEKGAFEARPLASITKLLTALLLAEEIPDHVYIPLSKDAIGQDGEEGLVAGDKLKKEDLINFMLVSSSNDAAYAAGEFIGEKLEGNEKARLSKFVALMNDRAREIGMLSSSFLNPHGLDVFVNLKRISGANGSAFDVAVLMNYVYAHYPELLSRTSETSLEVESQQGRIYTAKNTNHAAGDIPQLIGAKTGSTKLAGGNLTFIFDAGFEHPVLAVVLGSSEEERFGDAKKIVEAVFRYIQK